MRGGLIVAPIARRFVVICTALLIASGAISRNETVGAGACGRLVQGLDITTCGASNVAGLP